MTFVEVSVSKRCTALIGIFMNARWPGLGKPASPLPLRTVESPIKLLFLAHVYGVTLSPGQIAVFLGTLLILSFSTAGIPSVGTVRSIPAYLAAGIPLEGVIVLNAVAPLTDVFETLINVTADMSAAVIVTRNGAEKAA